MKIDFKNILIRSDKPSEYLLFLKKANKLSLYPELFSLVITTQDPIWHPEGSVWNHTLLVLDVAAELKHEISDEKTALAYMLGALCHDFGKPYSTVYSGGRIKSPMHDSLGIPPTYSFLKKIDALDLFVSVKNYVLEHLKPIQLYKVKDTVRDVSIKKLNDRIFIPDLIRLAKADHWGRTDLEANERVFPAGDWLLNKYKTIVECEIKPKALLRGKYIKRFGIEDGKLIGAIIKESLELQILGIIQNEIDANNFAYKKLKEMGLIK